MPKLDGVQTKESLNLPYFVEGPAVIKGRILGLIFSRSSSKGTPCAELTIAQTDYPEYPQRDLEMPVTNYLTSGNSVVRNMPGPICVNRYWLNKSAKTDSYFAWDASNPKSFVQVLLKIAETVGKREELVSFGDFPEEDPSAFIAHADKVLKGSEAVFVIQREDTFSTNTQTSEVTHRVEPLLAVFDPFVAPLDQYESIKSDFNAQRSSDPSYLIRKINKQYTPNAPAPSNGNMGATTTPSIDF